MWKNRISLMSYMKIMIALTKDKRVRSPFSSETLHV